MLVGLVSDTHNNVEQTLKAVTIFKQRNIDLLIHAGDFTSPKILEYFKDFNCRFVLGNADIDIAELNAVCETCGHGAIQDSCSFDFDDKKFIVFHGNDVPLFRQAVASGQYDYIIKGHTHFYENYVSGKTRVINPGSLYEQGECSIAILETTSGKVEIIRIHED